MIDKVLEKMQLLLKAQNFPSEQHSINHLLNCCRILTRLIPFVFESSDCLEWEDAFFWTPRQVEKEKKNPDDKPEYDILPCRGELVLDCKAFFFFFYVCQALIDLHTNFDSLQ